MLQKTTEKKNEFDERNAGAWVRLLSFIFLKRNRSISPQHYHE